MIKLLKKYGVELKLKKCDLFRLIEGQKDTFLEDGFAFKMTNEEEMFKYEVILNGIYNKTKIEGEDKKFVYVLNDDSTVTSTEITIASIDNGKEYMVTSGLKAGDRIVTEGVNTLKDGMTIKAAGSQNNQ